MPYCNYCNNAVIDPLDRGVCFCKLKEHTVSSKTGRSCPAFKTNLRFRDKIQETYLTLSQWEQLGYAKCNGAVGELMFPDSKAKHPIVYYSVLDVRRVRR